jgi:hypothetical protein
LQATQTLVRQLLHVTTADSNDVPRDVVLLWPASFGLEDIGEGGGGMKVPPHRDVLLGQKMRDSHGTLYSSAAWRKTCCSARLRTDLIVAPGMGCVQHLGGNLDSSVTHCAIMTDRQVRQ